MKRLFINDTEIDIYQSQSITLNFQCADVGELRSVGSGTQTIKLPQTAKNKVFFEHSHEINSGSVFPYLIHGARYYEDETLLIDDGNFYMLAVNDFYECCITWGNAPFLKKAEEIKMVEIDLGVWRTMGNGSLASKEPLSIQMDESVLADARSEKVFDSNGDIIEYSTTVQSWNVNNPIAIRSLFVRPHIYLSKILDSLFNFLNIDYIIKNSALNEEIKKIIIPQVKNKIKYDKYKIKFLLDNTSTASRLYTTLQGNEELTAGIVIANTGEMVRFNQGGDCFYIANNSFYNISFKVSFSQNHIGEWTGGINSTQIVLSKLAKFFFSANTNTEIVSFTINQSSINDYTISFENIWLLKGYYYFCVQGQGYDSTLIYGTDYAFVFDVIGEILIEDVNKNQFEIDVLKDYVYYNHNSVLREYNIKEVLQGILQVFGTIAQMKNNIMEIFTPVEIVNNISLARDWSSKVVNVTRNNYKDLKFENKIGKINYLKWKDEELYKKSQNGNFIANSIKEENTFFENNLFSQVDEYVRGNLINLNYIKRSENLNTFEIADYDSSPKMLVVEENYYNGISIYNSNPPTIIPNNILRVASFEYFNYNNPNGIRKYIQPLLNSLNKVKIVTVTMVLTPTDLEDLDFKIPIYLEQFGAYFMLNKISGYKYGGKCDVELLRLEI